MKVFFFFLIFTPLFAQQAKLDSILSKLNGKPDTAKIHYLNDFAWNNRNKNPNLALLCGKEAFKIAQSIDNKSLCAKALNLNGVIYRNLGNYDLSLVTYNSALKFAEAEKDSIQIAYSFNNIGGIHRLEGNNKTALEYILKGLKIFERQNNKEGISFCTINIGLIYRRMQNYAKALEYLEYTTKIRDELNDKAGRALALNMIAEVYFDMGNIDNSLKYYLEVEKEYKAVDDKKGLAATWGGIGGVYFFKKDYARALSYRKQALEMSKKIDYLEGQVSNYNNIGKIYSQQGNFGLAEPYFKKAFKIAGEMREIYLQIECYKYLAEFHELKNDLKNALMYNKKYWALKDSVNKQENIALLNEFENMYKNEKIENANRTLQQENEGQQRKMYYLIGLLLVFIVFVFILYRYSVKAGKLNLKLNELNTIKDRFFHIIAHDLRNPFNALLGLSEMLEVHFHSMNEEERLSLIVEIRNALKSNYQLLENLLQWANAQREEIKYHPQKIYLSNILNDLNPLFLIALKNKNLTLLTSCDNSITIYADNEMLKAILRNLISNAIKFSPEKSEIKISARLIDNFAEICIEDNGVGMDPEKVNSLFRLDKISVTHGTDGEIGTGLGLILCNEFIIKNGGKISVESRLGKGSKFLITLPEFNEERS